MTPELFLQRSWQLLQKVTMLNSFTLLSIVIFTISVVYAYKLYTAGKDTTLNSPPSPPKLPILGNLHQLVSLPHRSLQALSKKYGPIMLLNIGYTQALVITSDEIVKEIAKYHDVAFSNRPKTTAVDNLFYGVDELVFAPYGEHWRRVKKVCVHELLSDHRVGSFQGVRDEEVALIIEKIQVSCENESNSINLFEILIEVSNNIITRCVLGKKDVNGENGKNKIGYMARKLTVQFTSFSFGDFFPWLGWLDSLTGLISRMKATFSEWDSYFDHVIEQHKTFQIKDRLLDFVDILLQIQNDDSVDFDLTDKKLKAILMDMIGAGTETTSTTMEWIIAELIKNPSKLKCAQEEVRRVVGVKTKVCAEDIHQMRYLKCVIKEALRLHSPTPLLVPRETSGSIKLAGYAIPAKTTVLVNAWAIQREKQIWGDDAEEFIPERFQNSPIDFKGQHFEFIPFGMGRRRCPGMSFGLATIEQVVENLLYWFDWELPEGLSVENMNMSEVYGLTAPKKHPLCLIATLYSPQ